MTVELNDVQALLGFDITATQWDAARSMVTREINAALPDGSSMGTLTNSRNIDLVDSVFTTVIIRLLTNPAGAQQAGTDGQYASFQGGEGLGVAALTLRKSERDKLAKIVPEDGTDVTPKRRAASFAAIADW